MEYSTKTRRISSPWLIFSVAWLFSNFAQRMVMILPCEISKQLGKNDMDECDFIRCEFKKSSTQLNLEGIPYHNSSQALHGKVISILGIHHLRQACPCFVLKMDFKHLCLINLWWIVQNKKMYHTWKRFCLERIIHPLCRSAPMCRLSEAYMG